MNYRTLILTVLMTVGCMSNASEHRPQATTGLSLLNASIWGVGVLTAFLGLKAGYHFVQACHYNKKYSQLQLDYNEAVMDAGRSKLEQGEQLLDNTRTNDEYKPVYGQEYVQVQKSKGLLFSHQSLVSKLDTGGRFSLLSKWEKRQLLTKKEAVVVKNNTNTRRFMQHTQQQYLTTALFLVSGSALMGAYLFKNRSSQK